MERFKGIYGETLLKQKLVEDSCLWFAFPEFIYNKEYYKCIKLQ